ncbi:hypothetical protein ACFV1C_14345 [Streptomyces sp. NPDC059605]|uniref:hypothetical protein n=1 Tax=unclassified Streptomyces TaxID=2593676 RepID=UPI0036AF1FC8
MKDLAESAHGQCVRPSAGGGEAASRLPRSAAELTPRLVRPLTDADNVSLRTAAAGAVWELERSPGTVVPLLERLLDHHRNFDAIDLAGRIGPPAAAVLPRLRQILNEQVERNARNEQNDSAVLNDSWTLVHVASALWDMGGDDEADVVVPALLNAWRDNDSTACDVVACLDRMGPAARPALAGRPAPGTGHGRQARGKGDRHGARRKPRNSALPITSCAVRRAGGHEPGEGHLGARRIRKSAPGSRHTPASGTERRARTNGRPGLSVPAGPACSPGTAVPYPGRVSGPVAVPVPDP